MDISLYYIKGIHLKQNKPEKVKVKQRKNYGIQKEKKKEREETEKAPESKVGEKRREAE